MKRSMQIDIKNFKINKTKNYIKYNSLFFVLNGSNKNSKNWLLIEQEIKTAELSYYKTFNKIVLKVIQNSVYSSIKPSINGIVFFIKPTKKSLILKNEIKKLKTMFFTPMYVKFNNKIYSTNQLTKLNSVEYKILKVVLYKFQVANLKLYFK